MSKITDTVGLEQAMRRTFSGEEHLAAQSILNAVEGELQAWLGTGLVPETHTEIIAYPPNIDARGNLRLRNRPVVSIASATLDGTLLDPSTYVVSPTGIRAHYGLTFAPLFGQAMVVEYVGGLTGASIDGLPEACYTVAARAMQQAILDAAPAASAQTVEGESVTYRAPVGPYWTDDELWRWSLYRVRRGT